MSLEKIKAAINDWANGLLVDDVRSYVISDLDIEISGGIFEIWDSEGDISDYVERYWINGEEVPFDKMMSIVKGAYRKKYPRTTRIKYPEQLSLFSKINSVA